MTATVRSVDGQTQIAEHHLPLSAVPYALYADYSDSVDLAVLQNYLDEHHYVTEGELPSAQANADWTESNPDTASFIKHKPDLGVYATSEHLDDTLGHYVLNTDFSDFTDEVGENFTKMTDRIDTLLTHVCDSVSDCVHGWISDSTRMVIDSLGAYYDTTQVKTAIHDTADVLRSMMGEAANDGQITIEVVGGTVENPTFGVNQAENQTVTITVPEATAPNDGLLMIVAAGDTTRFTANQADNDTVRLNKFATKDTLAYYATTSALKDSLSHYVGKEMLNDTLAYYTTSNQLDTVIRKYGYVTNAHLNDTLTAVYNTIRTDSAALHKAIKDTASAIRGDLCDSATACITKAMADANSAINHAIDTIARHNISDTATAIRNSIGNGTLTITYGTQTPVIFTANQKNNSEITIPTPAAPNNGQITITRNGTAITNGEFTVDQSNSQTIDIEVPTKLSQMINNGGVYAKRDSVNVFTENNSFTGTVTAPAGFVVKGNNATNSTNCGNVVVNACDLWSVFDSLNRRMQALENALATTQQELDALKSATPPAVSVSLSEVQYTSMKATATASGNGANITSYKFCISTNNNMSDATCVTSSSNEYTFTELSANTDYYVTVDATNMAGTTTSEVVSKRTAMHAPSGTFSLQSIAPKGFTVTVSNLNFQEPAAGTVQICYKKNDGTCPTDFSSYSTCDAVLNLTSSTTDTTRKLFNIDEETGVEYCVIVKLTNDDSTTILGPSTVNTGAAILLNITHTPETLDCLKEGDSVSVYFEATPSIEGDYTCEWSDGTNTVQGNPALMRFKTAGGKIITCTATHNTEGYSVEGAYPLTISSAPAFDIAISYLTVTLQLGQNVALDSIAWGDGNGTKNPANGATHTYEVDGPKTITLFSLAGCTVDTAITLFDCASEVELAHCTVISAHTNTSEYDDSSKGGLETVDQTTGKVTHVTDQDGNTYPVVQIGNQCWMAENLRATKYSSVVSNASLTQINSQALNRYYYYPNSSETNVNTYGYLYNWNAATDSGRSTQGICPKGWHVPSEGDFSTLLNCPTANNAAKLSKGCSWLPSSIIYETGPNNFSNQDRNSSGFGALPAGNLAPDDNGFGLMAYFWSSTRILGDPTCLTFGSIPQYSTSPSLPKYAREEYMSVRCIRNVPSLSLVASPDDASVTICSSTIPPALSDAHTVTFTATIENDNTADYTFAWEINGSDYEGDDANSSAITLHWLNADDYTVTCTATKGDVVLEESISISVAVGEYPNFGIGSINSLTVRVDIVPGNNVAYIDWGDNTSENVPNNVGNVTHTYQITGTYMITVLSTSNCLIDTSVTVVDCASNFVCGVCRLNDADNNTYNTVLIGEGSNAQCWMKENLRTTKYADGTTISQGSNHSTSVAYWYYPNNDANNKPTYGLLYNWKAVMRAENSSTSVPSGVQGICPEGWHVPSDQELQNLISNSSSSTATGKLAGGGSGTWYSSTGSAVPGNYEYGEHNSSGFSALPAGCYEDTYYDAFRSIAYFWSSTASPNYSGESVFLALYYNQSIPNHTSCLKENGCSVRCIRDAE